MAEWRLSKSSTSPAECVQGRVGNPRRPSLLNLQKPHGHWLLGVFHLQLLWGLLLHAIEHDLELLGQQRVPLWTRQATSIGATPCLTRQSETPLRSRQVAGKVKSTGDHFYLDKDTADDVRHVLNSVYAGSRRGARIRVWYGNVVTGRAWNNTFNVAGYLGSTTKRIQEPVIRALKSATEGEIVNAAQIVRIDMVETGETLYRHAKFHVGAFSELSTSWSPHKGKRPLV
jgi:hypothetical protein